MAVSTTKKVLVTRFDREPLAGFVNPQSYLQAGGLELLSQSGAVSVVPYGEIKLVCFVRDFQQGEPRKELRLFTTRPKMEGPNLIAIFAPKPAGAVSTKAQKVHETKNT